MMVRRHILVASRTWLPSPSMSMQIQVVYLGLVALLWSMVPLAELAVHPYYLMLPTLLPVAYRVLHPRLVCLRLAAMTN